MPTNLVILMQEISSRPEPIDEDTAGTAAATAIAAAGNQTAAAAAEGTADNRNNVMCGPSQLRVALWSR